MRVICVIPARYSSTRFEGKPLADICGSPMIQRVYERARRARIVSDVVVATDDERIFETVRRFGGKVVMTSAAHRSGTDRIAEAVSGLAAADGDIVVNIQGDQPLFEPSQIDEVVKPLMDEPSVQFATLIYRIRRTEEINDPNAVKVVFDRNHFALYFSRSPIPCYRDAVADPVYYKHHGIYAYRKSFLMTFTKLTEGFLERTEALEQLRAMEHGFRIKVVETQRDSIEVDTPQELERVRRVYEKGEA